MYSDFRTHILLRVNGVEIQGYLVDDLLLDKSRIHVENYKSLVPSEDVIHLYGNVYICGFGPFVCGFAKGAKVGRRPGLKGKVILCYNERIGRRRRLQCSSRSK